MENQDKTLFITTQQSDLTPFPKIKLPGLGWYHFHPIQAILPLMAVIYMLTAFSSQTQKILQKALASCKKALASGRKACDDFLMASVFYMKAIEAFKMPSMKMQVACDGCQKASDHRTRTPVHCI